VSRDQRLILAGMAVALGITVALFFLPVGHGGGDALRIACFCLLAPAICVTAGVGFIANQRFLHAEAIDGSRTTPAIDLAQRYLTNTAEQGLLAGMAWLAFAAAAPDRAAAMLPVLAVTFMVARAMFALGYAMPPWARAFGFALTFYPSVAVILATSAAMVA
jgi:hypothetical protein